MTPPVVGPDDHVDTLRARRACPVGHQRAQLGHSLGPLQDLELLDVAIAVATALELEVALAIGARLGEELLDARGDG